MRKIASYCYLALALAFFSWPVTTSAQYTKVKSANYKQNNGSDYYSRQRKSSANYSTLRDKDLHNKRANSIGEKASKAADKAKRDAAAKQKPSSTSSTQSKSNK